jgi:hypothetical protein
MIIYLCVKTHNITGLKYLCKTKKDPFKYHGSGVDWKSHLNKYGYSHITEIIKICETNEELSFWGRYYSKIWNIVNGQDDFGNKIWANRIPETGGGGGRAKGWIPSPEWRSQKSLSLRGKKQDPDKVKLRQISNIGKKRTAETCKNMSIAATGRKQTVETIAKRSASKFGKKYPNIGKSRIGIKRPDISKLLKGVRLSDTVRSNMSVPKGPQAIKTCPHCGKSGGNAMTRHHFNNCKTITNINGENSQAK